MWMYKDKRQRLICSLVLALIAISCAASGETCERGAQLVKIGEFQKALDVWKGSSYDSTLKEETRVTMDCLIKTKIAIDDGETAVWLFRAADKGILDAEAQLGMLFYLGTGVRQNIDIAIYLWEKAAQAGLREAETTLGTLYLLGPNELRDIKKGKLLLDRAIRQGDPNAQPILQQYYKQQ
jgi:TPR repeat protein